MKKLLSLFLVGVLAVSMFSFISPNHVDAMGENVDSAGGYVCIKPGIANGFCYIVYKDSNNSEKSTDMVTFSIDQETRVPIPAQAANGQTIHVDLFFEAQGKQHKGEFFLSATKQTINPTKDSTTISRSGSNRIIQYVSNGWIEKGTNIY